MILNAHAVGARSESKSAWCCVSKRRRTRGERAPLEPCSATVRHCLAKGRTILSRTYACEHDRYVCLRLPIVAGERRGRSPSVRCSCLCAQCTILHALLSTVECLGTCTPCVTGFLLVTRCCEVVLNIPSSTLSHYRLSKRKSLDRRHADIGT